MTMCYGFQRTDGNNPGSSAYSLLRPSEKHGQVATPVVTFSLAEDGSGCWIGVDDVFERDIRMFLTYKDVEKLAKHVRTFHSTSFTKKIKGLSHGYWLDGTVRLGWGTDGFGKMEFTQRFHEPGEYSSGVMETKVSIWLEHPANIQLADYLDGNP